jgi:hypothetical protein
MFIKHNSKLISLSKAIKNLNTDSKDLQKYAGFISLLAGVGKFLAKGASLFRLGIINKEVL